MVIIAVPRLSEQLARISAIAVVNGTVRDVAEEVEVFMGSP